MITLFHLIQFLLVIGSIVVGVAAGHNTFGIVGAIGGGALGGYVGAYVGSWPLRIRLWRMRKRLAPLSVEQLEAYLSQCHLSLPGPNYVLLELQLRGEDSQKHLPRVLEMLCSDSIIERQLGYAGLLSVFPETVRELGWYNPSAPVEKCRKKVEASKQRSEKG
jgi:hypothetical protein